MVYAKCTPFDPSNHWGAFTRGPHSLTEIFIIFHPKTTFFVLKHPKFSYTTCHQKTPLKTPSFLSRKEHFFKLTLSPKDPYILFKCLMYVSLYKSCAPGYLHPPVSPTEVLHRSIMQGQQPSDTRRAVCTQSFPRQLYSRTHNARLKFCNKCTRSIATSLQKP